MISIIILIRSDVKPHLSKLIAATKMTLMTLKRGLGLGLLWRNYEIIATSTVHHLRVTCPVPSRPVVCCRPLTAVVACDFYIESSLRSLLEEFEFPSMSTSIGYEML